MKDLKQLTINLAAPKTSSYSNSVVHKSFRSFHKNELVGLGIVAAMSNCTSSSSTTTTIHHNHPETSSPKIKHQIRAAKLLSDSVTKPMIRGSKSIPIQCLSGAGTAAVLGFRFGDERLAVGGGDFEDEMMMMEMEMLESYTCVVSQIGIDRVSKREYIDDRVLSVNNLMRSTGVVTRGVFSKSLIDVVENEEMPVWDGVDFLSSCFLCGKDLCGIDIFMYRGEKAFCSVECREVQIHTDKLKEKRGHVRVRTMEHSESPCCSPMLSYTGVVAARV